MHAIHSAIESGIGTRLEQVHEAIAAAAQGVGRNPKSVRLVVVTKSQPLPVVQAAIRAGARILGENYAEEAAAKISAILDGSVLADPVEWHMIGHIQSRKVRLVAPHFQLIHSVDSKKLALRLDRAAAELGRPISILLEFNVGGEPAKHGWNAAEQYRWAALLPEISEVALLPNLRIRGLMTMPPLSASAQESRPFFRRLRALQDYLAGRLSAANWSELSMGTSADYTVAVEEGATLVRVGEAILGPRPVREST